MTSATPSRFALFVGTALALAIGWGIRGNYGHETGAMIPGALAAMAAVILSGRSDWFSRIPYFGFFGALGWSFGGSISYMQVIGYTHSGHSLSVFYGFASLFLIGFIWAALGGAGTTLPAILSEEELKSFFPPILVIFSAWLFQDFLVEHLFNTDPAFRQRDPLYWYDTDWLGVSVALLATFIYALLRRKFDSATSLIIYMALGWWAGFLLLVIVLGWRMTPPRGDNWAGCLGMVIAALIFFERKKWRLLTVSSLLSGVFGGIAFAVADLFKLLAIKSGWTTNWHSVLEQSYGFINGLGIAATILFLLQTAPPAQPLSARKGWKCFSAFFTLVVITYLNLRKNPGVWLNAKAVPELLYGLSPQTWFNIAHLLIAALLLTLLLIHAKSPLPFIPTNALGKAQLLFLVLLWWIVLGNFERALVHFAPQRLITEGIIFLNALLCTLIVLWPRSETTLHFQPAISLSRTFHFLWLAALLTPTLCWAVTRLAYGNTQAPFANRHIRFGPDATATAQKPNPDKPHP
jgi:hypothetical protein